MPFVWVNEPQQPIRQVIEVPGPATVSYKVDAVANNVNAGGELLYDTPNSEYDIIYQVRQLNAAVVTIETAKINTMIVTGQATIDTANVGNAFFQNVTANTIHVEVGFGTNLPTTNLEIATKEYVDIAVANVPVGGSELQNVIDAAGDLIAGTGPNTATRHPIGTTGQILIADSTTATGLRWRDKSLTAAVESYSGVILMTHPNKNLQNTTVLLIKAKEIILNSGSRTSNWSNLTCSIENSGAGGIDDGVKKHSQWYEIYVIRNSNNNDRSLVFHKANNTVIDASFTTNTNISRVLNDSSNTKSRLGESFMSANTGPLTSVELEVSRVGSPDGLVWATLETDSGGFPSSILANSNFLDASSFSTDKSRIRFIFNTQPDIATNTSYHIVLNCDYTASNTDHILLWGDSSNVYSNGQAVEFRTGTNDWINSIDDAGPQTFWFKAFVQNETSSQFTPPGSYDEYALLGFVYINEEGRLKHLIQKDRTITSSIYPDWKGFTTQTGNVETADLSTVIPPRRGIATLHIYRPAGAPARSISVGRLNATDLPANVNTGFGFISSNTFGVTLGVARGPRVENYPPIIIENQAVTIRSLVPNARIYVVGFEF